MQEGKDGVWGKVNRVFICKNLRADLQPQSSVSEFLDQYPCEIDTACTGNGGLGHASGPAQFTARQQAALSAQYKRL